MAIQVWKPEHERTGRHFVYTSRYVLFLVSLLEQTEDRTNLEALARKIRKKAGDFCDHLQIWIQMCQTYCKVDSLSGAHDAALADEGTASPSARTYS